MDKYIDKEMQKFLLLFAGLMIVVYFIIPNFNSKTFNALFANQAGKVFEPNPVIQNLVYPSLSDQQIQEKLVKLEDKKDYKLKVKTNYGTFAIDLFETTAPINVRNIITNELLYKNAKITPDNNYLIKIDASDPSYVIQNEINADFLLLDRKKVKDSPFLKEKYDSKDSATDPYKEENLAKYSEFSLKEFYTEVLKYKYSKDLATTNAVKYVVYVTNTGADKNKIDLFIVMAGSAPEIDGLYTPIGRISDGFPTVDKINTLTTKDIKVESVTTEK